MATVLNRTTKQLIRSANTPDYPELDWIIEPNLSAVMGVLVKYWVITGDIVSEMSQPEKDTIDAAEAQSQEDSELSELDGGILKRFVLVLLDEVNRSRIADGANTITIAQLKTAMRAK